MSTTPVTFSGMSSYAADFQNVITRAVQIASLPITQLNNTKTDLTDQVNEYLTLDGDMSSLRMAMSQLQDALTGTGSYSVSSSSTSVLTASASTGALQGSYDVSVSQLGAYAKYMSTSSLQGSIAAGDYTFTVDPGTGTAATYSLNITGTNMSDLVDAINKSGAPVQASMVNMGTSTAPSYRLSLESTGMADVKMTLKQGLSTDDLSAVPDLLTQTGSPGQPMQYSINGDSTVLSSNSPTITLSTGLTATLLSTGNSTVTVGRTTSSTASALSAIATAYNALMNELNNNHGQSGGALTGQSQVMSLESDLRQLLTFKSSDGVGSMAALGLTFQKDGTASFDTTTLNSLSFADIQSFLGSSSSGFIQNANTLMDEMDGSNSGIVTDTVQSLKEQITKTNSQIDDQQQRVDVLQTSLMDQMSKADSAIYSMEQQADYYKNLFQAMQQDSKNITG